MKKTILTLLASIVLSAGIFAQNVAVMDFSCDNPSFADKIELMTDLLRHEFVKQGNITLVERKEIEQIKNEMLFQLEGWTDPATVKETGKMLNADCIIIGSVSSLNGPVCITARMIEVETAKVLHSSKMTLDNWDDYEKKLPTFARDCVAKMPVPEYFPGTWLGTATTENGTDYEYQITLEKGTKATVKVTAINALGNEVEQIGTGAYSYDKNIFRLNVVFKKGAIKEMRRINWISAYTFADAGHTSFNVVVAPDDTTQKKIRVTFAKEQ